MEESQEPGRNPKKSLIVQGEYLGANSKTATTPKRGLVREVCREWLVHEDGALAHQLQDQEIAAHYGHNREKNRMVRQDTPHARMEQEDELKQALALQKLQQEIKLQQEKDDEEAARQLAEELEREEELQRQVRAIRDEQLAKRLQNAATTKIPKTNARDLEDIQVNPAETICTSMRVLDINQPMSEEEARQWQELCDAEMARKLQLDEEEESKFRRDVTDLSRKLAIEAQDRELARMLQEKEKARLRKAKEKARLRAQQKAAASLVEVEPAELRSSLGEAQYVHPPENIAACIDPTWNRRQQNNEYRSPQMMMTQAPIPITDLDFPAPVQPIVAGQRRGINHGPNSQPVSPEPSSRNDPIRNKSGSGCSHQ